MDVFSKFRALYRSKRWVRWVTEATVLFLAVLLIGVWQTRGHLRGDAPDFTFAQLDGPSAVSSTSLRGKPTMLVFWAPWCSVCKAEARNISWVQRLVGRRAQVVSVVTGYRNTEEVRRWKEEHGVEYPVLLGDDAIVERFGISAFPSVYFVDPAGRIHGSVVGYTTTLGLWLRLLAAS